jgi:hypothetical protein
LGCRMTVVGYVGWVVFLRDPTAQAQLPRE